jgi:hypothetical protein
MQQPVTIKQWSHMSGIVFEQCRQIIIAARNQGLVKCINPTARRHRVYFFTFDGLKAQKEVRHKRGFHEVVYDLPELDWVLYGECCFPHRAAVIKAIREPMQSCTIRAAYAAIHFTDRDTIEAFGIRVRGRAYAQNR